MRNPEAHPGINLLWPDAAEALFKAAEAPLDVVPTPFAGWNKACRGHGGQQGLGRGWHVVVGADTKQGKTLLGLQCALAAVMGGHSVGYLNLEMARDQLQSRLYSQLSGAPSWQLEPGSGFNRRKADEVIGMLHELRGVHADRGVCLWSNRDPVTDLLAALEHIAGWVEGWGCRLIIVDYMQLIESPESAGIADEIRRISAHLVQFTHAHRVNTIALSQLSNEGAQTTPHAGSLYGGRRISQDADQVLFLDHTKRETREETKGHYYTRSWLRMPYNRHGPPAEIPIEWDWNSLRAREALPDEEHLWPR
jgi:replicative DNA helicase